LHQLREFPAIDWDEFRAGDRRSSVVYGPQNRSGHVPEFDNQMIVIAIQPTIGIDPSSIRDDAACQFGSLEHAARPVWSVVRPSALDRHKIEPTGQDNPTIQATIQNGARLAYHRQRIRSGSVSNTIRQRGEHNPDL
jgi:hypothetical protein